MNNSENEQWRLEGNCSIGGGHMTQQRAYLMDLKKGLNHD